MGRDLSVREREVVAFLILHGQPLPGDPAPTLEQRQLLLSQLMSAQAGPRCDCRQCPSIEIQNAAGHTPPEGNRITLHAIAPAAEITLFVDDDQLSYLELAPTTELVAQIFPSPRVLTVTPLSQISSTYRQPLGAE